ncbi:Coatomer [Perilla frutescens var. hirtella]|nr:Coatomer [Perilla frutescens var. hirtella]
MQVEADEEHLENGGLDYDDGEPNDQVLQKEDDTQVDGHDESPEEAVVVDADSTNGAVLVNGNEAEEEWDANNDGKPSASKQLVGPV